MKLTKEKILTILSGIPSVIIFNDDEEIKRSEECLWRIDASIATHFEIMEKDFEYFYLLLSIYRSKPITEKKIISPIKISILHGGARCEFWRMEEETGEKIISSIDFTEENKNFVKNMCYRIEQDVFESNESIFNIFEDPQSSTIIRRFIDNTYLNVSRDLFCFVYKNNTILNGIEEALKSREKAKLDEMSGVFLNKKDGSIIKYSDLEHIEDCDEHSLRKHLIDRVLNEDERNR